MEDKIYLHYDEQGNIKGFYLKSIHGDNIPSPTIEITPEKHRFYMENNGRIKLNPQTLEDEEIQPPQPTEEEQIKSELQSLDGHLSRAAEDLIEAMNVDVTTLPQIMQDRLARKQELREQLRIITQSI